MKRLISFFAISGLLITPNFDSCEYFHGEWHNENPATINDHHSPTPEHNISAPTDEGSAVREIEDTFSQEDHSDKDGNGNNRVLTDQPLEEHLDEMVDCDDSGTVDEDYPTIPCDKTLHYDTRRGFNPGQKLDREDVFGDASNKGENHYTIKNTSGMIYKTDQVTCDTAYEHPTTGFTSGKPGEETNHGYVTNDAGELFLNSDDKYCFYLLIPGNGHSPGKIARVDENDQNSIEEIKTGVVPYLPLDDEYKNKLEAGTGDLSFVNGRYITPMPEGKMLLPTNGNNLLFNRTTVYRPYMQDVWRAEKGAASELMDMGMLDDTTFEPANEEGSKKSEFFKLGENVRMTGLAHETSLITKPDSDTTGKKLSDWGTISKEQPNQYLAVGPESDPSKELNVALHFPNNETEAEYLQKVTDGSFEPNETRAEIPAGRGHQLLALDERQNMLSDAVKFQMLAKSKYRIDDAMKTFNANVLEGTPKTTCDKADEAIQEFCDKYKPLRDNLEKLYTELGIENVEGATEALQVKLNGPLNSNVAVGGHNWKVSAARAAIGRFGNNDKIKHLLNDVNYYGLLGKAPDETKPGFLEYINNTNEGHMQQTMLRRIMKSSNDDAEKVSQENLFNKEHQEYINLVDPHKSKSDDELKNELRTIVNSRYKEFETNNITNSAFKYYTTQDNDGKQLLIKLALIQTGINSPDKTSGVNWEGLIPESLLARCGRNTVVENCREIITAPVVSADLDPDKLMMRFDPKASPLKMEVMPN